MSNPKKTKQRQKQASTGAVGKSSNPSSSSRASSSTTSLLGSGRAGVKTKASRASLEGGEGSVAAQTSWASQDSPQLETPDQTMPIRKKTLTSESKDEGRARDEGKRAGAADRSIQEPVMSAASAKKPSTKTERRALQEAQRKAKAERQIASSKAGQAAAKEGKNTKEVKPSGHKTSVGGGGGGEDKILLHQMGTHLSRSTTSKSPIVPGWKMPQHFSHLPQKARVINFLKDYHPPRCIVQLGLQYSEQLICGSNARCVAMLAAFKKVIQDYSTPPEKELRRDLDSVIKPHINFLTQCRPLSVSMGNAIKHLKLKISQVPPEMTETDAKKSLCDMIDDYIREKIELADKAISEFCLKMINDGDVILVHAYSSIVLCCLIDAHKSGKKFRVIVVDSRPKMEGEETLRELVSEGIKCSYVLISAVSYIMKEVSKVIFGAHGLLANGYVKSRIGTSLIALVAKSYNVPVLVCCETYKFCDKVQTDSFVINELGDPNDLVPIHRRQGNFLRDWKSIENLQLLNLMYDVTSPDLISMVITQLGNIPCTSVPVVLRISHTYEQM